MALGIDEQVALASPDVFSGVVALLRTTNGTGFDRLTVDNRRAGFRVSALPVAHLHAQGSKDLIPDSFAPPAAEVPVDGAPGRKIMGQQSPRASAAQHVEDGIDDFAPLILVIS